MEPGKLLRWLLGGSSILLTIATLMWVQAKFDGADRKAAMAVVQDYRAKKGSTIPELLADKHPGEAAQWSVRTESSCMQHERVTAVMAGETYAFDVDINGPSIHPGNRASEAIVAGLDTPRPAGSAAIEPAASGAVVAPPAGRP